MAKVPSGGQDLWFGRHTADDDTLVLDPALAPEGSAHIRFFSLTQLRTRSFPHGVVQSQIRAIEDPAQRAEAEHRYRALEALQAEREQERQEAADERLTRQRESIVDSHRLYLKALGLPYEGVQSSEEPGATAGSRRHRTSCQRCGIPLDDFARTRCIACSSVLCSCGACGCRQA